MPNKLSGGGPYNFSDKETGFNLSLPTFIEWEGPNGEHFKEKTVLSYISHRGASFWLENSVDLGSKIHLTIDLPQKLAEDKDLKLFIKGEVIFVEVTDDHKPRNRVSIRFESKYIIKEESLRNS
jgi:hypothetical protein